MRNYGDNDKQRNNASGGEREVLHANLAELHLHIALQVFAPVIKRSDISIIIELKTLRCFAHSNSRRCLAWIEICTIQITLVIDNNETTTRIVPATYDTNLISLLISPCAFDHVLPGVSNNSMKFQYDSNYY